MTDIKHTPGPWSASKFGTQVLTGDDWSTICEIKEDASWEDGRGDYPLQTPWERCEANARLIAAAPEMLDALKAIGAADEADLIGASDPAIRGLLYAAIRVARAAISKAEGKS